MVSRRANFGHFASILSDGQSQLEIREFWAMINWAKSRLIKGLEAIFCILRNRWNSSKMDVKRAKKPKVGRFSSNPKGAHNQQRCTKTGSFGNRKSLFLCGLEWKTRPKQAAGLSPISMHDEEKEFFHKFSGRCGGVVDTLVLHVRLLNLIQDFHYLHTRIISHSS